MGLAAAAAALPAEAVAEGGDLVSWIVLAVEEFAFDAAAPFATVDATLDDALEEALSVEDDERVALDKRLDASSGLIVLVSAGRVVEDPGGMTIVTVTVVTPFEFPESFVVEFPLLMAPEVPLVLVPFDVSPP